MFAYEKAPSERTMLLCGYQPFVFGWLPTPLGP